MRLTPRPLARPLRQILIAEERFDLVMQLLDEGNSMRLYATAAGAVDKMPELALSLATKFLNYVWKDTWLHYPTPSHDSASVLQYAHARPRTPLARISLTCV